MPKKRRQPVENARTNTVETGENVDNFKILYAMRLGAMAPLHQLLADAQEPKDYALTPSRR